ncbi:RNA recognition motif. family protein [Cryptosporidium muris RN66]|uniref:RNA recognition motif. family protein n=1 Tax=Cryptosporidium muris (strain RN66) TaxID=441375 RepID=B6AF72_CRYMR|nr:RNA recognition motif. family protein [Cryptosporidium muris RN66]EEA06839.1 RNA recognition motif. family protein [Cryptosporidium muris RN66]|eukprot:XP_002141188.1 RNA recognition motif. family protein [Cryptosporidium muris RN66]
MTSPSRERSSVGSKASKNQSPNSLDLGLTNNDTSCPLCMEEMDETDKTFYPCQCRYQICLWCYYHICDQLDNKCPACRQLYKVSNISKTIQNGTIERSIIDGFTWSGDKIMNMDDSNISQITGTTSTGELQTLTNESSIYNQSCTPSEDTLHQQSLGDMRIIQRNLVYVAGLDYSNAKREILAGSDSFGKFGKILNMRIVPIDYETYSAFITYCDELSATKAIKSVNGKKIFGNNTIRCSFGTNKYCSNFIRNLACTNPNCAYVHKLAESNDCINKSELLNFHSSNKFALKSLKELRSTIGFGISDNTNKLSENNDTRERRSTRSRNKRNVDKCLETTGIPTVTIDGDIVEDTTEDTITQSVTDQAIIQIADETADTLKNGSRVKQDPTISDNTLLESKNIDTKDTDNLIEKPLYFVGSQTISRKRPQLDDSNTVYNIKLGGSEEQKSINKEKFQQNQDEEIRYTETTSEHKDVTLAVRGEFLKSLPQGLKIVSVQSSQSSLNENYNPRCLSKGVQQLADVEAGILRSLQQHNNMRNSLGSGHHHSSIQQGLSILRAIMPHANITIQGQ